MTTAQVVICTDSRGYGLDKYIRENGALTGDYRVIAEGGLTLKKAQDTFGILKAQSQKQTKARNSAAYLQGFAT